MYQLSVRNQISSENVTKTQSSKLLGTVLEKLVTAGGTEKLANQSLLTPVIHVTVALW